MTRLITIIWVLFKHGALIGIGWVLRRRAVEVEETGEVVVPSGLSYPAPGRFRRALEELGPSFVKLGQLLSSRADIFPPDFIEELQKLQDTVPPEPFGVIRDRIETELKKPLDKLFAEFHPKPIGSASVAQVHKARLFSGEWVAVKVLRPGIRKKIRRDIRLMYSLAHKIERVSEIGRALSAVNIVDEFDRMIHKELDMFVEAGTIEKFAKGFQDVSEIYIPKVYWELTSKSVLVMEFIDGIKMDQVDKLKAHGIDPKEVARIGLRSFSLQLMEFGFFHADPHPGNTIVRFDGTVSPVDFGIVGYLDEDTKRQLANIFVGFSEHDYDMVLEALKDSGLIDERTAESKDFRIDLKDMTEPFFGRSLQTIHVKEVYDQVMRLVLKYHIRLPRHFLLLGKTFVQTEALGKILHSDASLLEAVKPYATRFLTKRYDPENMIKHLGRDARIMGEYLRDMPKYIHEIAKQTAAGKQRVEFVHSGFQSLDQHLVRGVNRLVVGLVLAASILAAAVVLNVKDNVFVFAFDFLGGKVVGLTELLGLIGYVIASILGIWLVISIFRSGKM